MDNSIKNFEDILWEMYNDNYIEPSSKWINLSLWDKKLKKEFKRIEKKKQQVLEVFANDCIKQASRKKKKCSLTFTWHGENLSKKEFQQMTSPFHENTLLLPYHISDLERALFDFQTNIENGSYIPKEAQNTLGISIDFSVV